MKIVIWGMGYLMQTYIDRKGLYKNDDIVAFVDNNSLLWGKSFLDIPILAPAELRETEFDCVIICSTDLSIKKQLINDLKVDIHRIKSIVEIEEYYTQKLIDKYKKSKDKEIQGIVANYKRNGVSVFGNYFPELTDYDVYRDEDNHPYVIYEGKRIYYPDTYRFFGRCNGKEYITDIMYEQKENSPHLYVIDENSILPGSVVVDAGACEGNFAIRFVERASKMYLIESDPLWIECLERTFRPFKNKVIICDKQLARYDSMSSITLDSLLKNQRIDFLKMDIEGSEIDALLGARNTLLDNNVNCAICCYHKMNDEENIRFILDSLGYQTNTSDGYMFFWYDENIYDTLDLRKGIVYASKGI